VKAPLKNGRQKNGSSVTRFQTMKSGSTFPYTPRVPISSIRCIPMA